MVDSADTPQLPGAAVIHLDCRSETICFCDRQAAAMLEQAEDTLLGRPWRDALGVPPGHESPLAAAVSARLRTALPPLLLSPPGVGERVVGGYLVPAEHAGLEAVALLLFPLSTGQPDAFAAGIAPPDVAAVLALDEQGQSDDWSPGDIARLMIDVRFGLQQIVPDHNAVGLPVGATIPVTLRNITLEQGQDISRALLSHLAPLLAGRARIRIGLAQAGKGDSGLATLLSANSALQRLPRVGAAELIGTATRGDARQSVMNAAGAEGLFSETGSRRQPSAYLAALAELVVDVHNADAYLTDIVDLTLRQPGVDTAAIYRRAFADTYEFAVAGALGDAGRVAMNEKQLPTQLRQYARKQKTARLRAGESVEYRKAATVVFPITLHDSVLGFLLLRYEQTAFAGPGIFSPDIAALHHLAAELVTLPGWGQSGEKVQQPSPTVAPPVEDVIDGYVGDNMEGAIDQAVFLSEIDVPVAVIGPRGTGKLYVAKVIHQEGGGAPDMLESIDCREFRSRKDALNRIARALQRSAGKTLVFKSPHLMNPDAQLKLARQLSSRVLADTSPPRYLPAARIIGLFPDSLEHLVQHGGLNEKLASVFAAYPIRVPPIKDRKRAVLRWAHKILAQEAARRDRKVTGFTPDAHEALLQHDWPGNISEMRQCIVNALDKTDKEWLTPVDLGIFKGLSAAGRAAVPPKRAFLQALVEEPEEEDTYAPTTLEELGVCLGETLHRMLELDAIKPLGAWLDDEVILAVCERYRDNMRAAADFLHTRPRNIGRWMPRVLSRDHERGSSSLWRTPQRLIRQWLLEAAPLADPPQQLVQEILLSHVLQQCSELSVADRARIMGVSVPTYQKRLQEIRQR